MTLVCRCCLSIVDKHSLTHYAGIIGGVLTLKSFQRDFRYTSKQNTKTQSLAVSLQQAGAFAACLFIWPLASKFGRKWTLAASAFIFIIGVIIETINTHSRSAFYVARVIAGLGLGAETVIVPMFSSEMMPKASFLPICIQRLPRTNIAS